MRPLKNDESLAIELEDEDLLDIDGSDDPTAAFSGRAVLAKLRAPAKKTRSGIRSPFSPFTRGPVEDPTIANGVDCDDRMTMPIPMKLAPKSVLPTAASAPVPASYAPKSPTISPAPPVRTRRNANSSYPPIAINVAPAAHRPPAMSFISERPSRAGWIMAAVLGALILIGGSIKVAAPKLPTAAAEPPPAAAVEPPPAAETPAEEPKVVTFGENQGVSIKPKAETKPEAKPEPKKAAPAPHVVAPKPAVKAASKADNSLALSKDKDDKIPSTSHDSKEAKVTTAEQKKLKSIEQDLADLQLKAAAR